MRLVLLLLLLLTTFNLSAQFAPEADPHRGMYIDKFFKLQLNSSTKLDPAFSILAVDKDRDGIYEKEDELLEYVAQNHITYINMYDIHRFLGKNLMAWDEEKKRNVKIEEHFCRFINKAKTQYGVTQIGAIGGSVNFFDSLTTYIDRYPVTDPYRLSNKIINSPRFDTTLYMVERTYPVGDPAEKTSELLKFCLRAMDFNACDSCQADIDVLNIEYEFWVDCPNFPHFMDIVNAMYSLKEMYNLDHPDNKMMTEAYVAAVHYCTTWGVTPIVQSMDGCDNCSPCPGCTTPHPPMIDRILYAWFGNDPGALNLAEQNHFENINTNDSTDFHPLLYSECYRTGGTADFIGTWFLNSPTHNIFTADESYYTSWINNSNVLLGTPQQNDVQPGGSHWFTATHMLEHMNDPQILQNTGPYCSGTGEAQIQFSYHGPIEHGIAYQFWITNDSDGSTVYPAAGGRVNGISQVYQALTGSTSLRKSIDFSDTLLFRPCFLTEGNYTAHLKLKYNFGTGEEYQCNNSVIVDTRPRIQNDGRSEFCEGDYTFLRVNGSGTYTWYKNGIAIPGSTSTLLVIEDGDYSCMVNGSTCSGMTDTIHVHVLPNPPIGVNAVCNGNGTVTLKTNLLDADPASTDVAGLSGLTYRWNTGATTEQITFTPSTSKTVYRVNVTNPYTSCFRTGQLSIVAPLVQNYTANINVLAQPTSPCASDGRLSAFISPSTGPNNYLWSNGATTHTISNLPPGTYSIAMNIWSSGCTAYDSVTIGTLPSNAPVVTPVIQNASCIDKADGSIVLNLSGGAGPFTYNWQNIPDDSIHDPFSKDLSSLYPGKYRLTITDAGGCKFIHEFEVPSANSSPTISSITTTEVTGCYNSLNGSATVNVTGGTTPYTYLWDDPTHQTTDNASNLAAGAVKITVTDFNGCTVESFALIETEELPLHVARLDSSSDESCIGLSDGNIYLCIHGGKEPYTVNSPWTIDSNHVMLEGVTSGSYPVEITDDDGCILQETFNISSPEPLEVFTDVTHTSCIGCVNGAIDVSFMGGSPVYQISWLPSVGMITNNRIHNLPTGAYSICVTDAKGCTTCVQDTVLENPNGLTAININDALQVYPNPFSDFTTIKLSDGILNGGLLKINGAEGNLVFSEKISFSTPVILSHKDLKPGIYFLELYSEKGEKFLGVKKVILIQK
jgi:hypothetical protein